MRSTEVVNPMTGSAESSRSSRSSTEFGRKLAAPFTVQLILLLVVIMSIATAPSAQAQEVSQPFTVDSPFRTSIPDDAGIDPNSAAMIAYAARENSVYASMAEFGIPIYQAENNTPRFTVECTITWWGPCPFDGYQIPIPADARPQTGSDGALVVIVDETSDLVFEFWQAQFADGQWTASFGAVNKLYGSGWGGSSTGSGASRLAGVILVDEIAAGEIPHALALQTDNICAGIYRQPAIKTDGTSLRADCIPEGARLRLDPTIDLDELELAPAVRTVARAMQVYGGYVVDAGGAPLSLSFERDPEAEDGQIGSVYEQAGLRWDYDNLPGVPWHSLQVIA